MDPAIDFRRDIDPNSLYELHSLLGEGSYGAVYSAKSRNIELENEVAIKIIPDADEDLTALWKEIRFLQVLRSPFVVSFIESLLYDNELWLVMELCDGGSLYDLKEANRGGFSEAQLRAIMAFCSMGLAHLHAQMSIHRDVKCGNILLTRDGKAKLGDFGISAQLTDTINKRKTVIGSPYWMAPEVIQETSYDGKADIWSLGITLLELCEGSPPHFSVHPMRAIFIISSRPPPSLREPEKWSEDMRDFVGKCLVKDCDRRASAADLLKHPWVRNIVKEIGSGGRGLSIIRELVDTHWDALQRIRASKMPDNIEDIGQSCADDRKPDEVGGTVRRVLSGIPATRQQMRNASLKRGLTLGREYDGEATIILRPGSGDREVGTVIRDAKEVQHKRDYYDVKDFDMIGTPLESSVIRHNTVNRVYSQETLVRKEDAGDIQAALKYFRDDPQPPSEPKLLKNLRDPPRFDKASNVENETSVAVESEILNEMIENCSQASVEMMRKEIMTQLSVLKKQYREDLENLTQSYESRRKALKDSLLALSQVTSTVSHGCSDNVRRK